MSIKALPPPQFGGIYLPSNPQLCTRNSHLKSINGNLISLWRWGDDPESLLTRPSVPHSFGPWIKHSLLLSSGPVSKIPTKSKIKSNCQKNIPKPTWSTQVQNSNYLSCATVNTIIVLQPFSSLSLKSVLGYSFSAIKDVPLTSFMDICIQDVIPLSRWFFQGISSLEFIEAAELKRCAGPSLSHVVTKADCTFLRLWVFSSQSTKNQNAISDELSRIIEHLNHSSSAPPNSPWTQSPLNLMHSCTLTHMQQCTWQCYVAGQTSAGISKLRCGNRPFVAHINISSR